MGGNELRGMTAMPAEPACISTHTLASAEAGIARGTCPDLAHVRGSE
jgi:hypothetical protein